MLKAHLFILCCEILQAATAFPLITTFPENSSLIADCKYLVGQPTFEALQLDIANISSLYSSWANKLYYNTETPEKQIAIFSKIVSSALQYTLYGESCYRTGKFLSKVQWQLLDDTYMDNRDCGSEELPNYEYRSLMDSRIMAPVVAPALLLLCARNSLSDSIRLTTIVNLRAAIGKVILNTYHPR